MPTYCWRCSSCDELTDIERKVADIESPPETCAHCAEPHFDRREVVPTIYKNGIKQFILLGDHGWSRCEYTKYRSIK